MFSGRPTALPLPFTLALAAIPSALGCGGIGNTYLVEADPAFTQDEQASIAAALDSWEAAVPAHLTMQIASCSGVQGGTICIHASDAATIAANNQSQLDGTGVGLTLRKSSWGHTVDGGEVFIDVPTIEQKGFAADFQRIIAHEVGHAMQLEHNAPNNLMAPMATEDAPTPTCTDASQWYALRGESAPACPK